jgi:nuclear GTP-binding protein
MTRSNSSTNPSRTADKTQVKGGSMRSKSTIRRLQMYKGPGLIRDRRGKVIDGDLLSNKKAGNKVLERMARVAPNRKWFGNTRVVGAKELDQFREEMGAKVADPYAVILKRKQLPMGLLSSAAHQPGQIRLLENETFESTFGPEARRKRPKAVAMSMEDMVRVCVCEWACGLLDSRRAARAHRPTAPSGCRASLRTRGRTPSRWSCGSRFRRA